MKLCLSDVVHTQHFVLKIAALSSVSKGLRGTSFELREEFGKCLGELGAVGPEKYVLVYHTFVIQFCMLSQCCTNLQLSEE